MSRRRTFFRDPEERSSLGDSHVEGAVIDINNTCASTVAVMARYTPTLDQTLHMLFPDDVYAKVAQVRGMIAPSTYTKRYDLGGGALLSIDYTSAWVLPIEDDMMRIDPSRASPLMHYVKEVRAIHTKFEEVKAMLRWLNRTATPGAIRYFWPTALKLCPQSPALLAQAAVPTRFHQPPDIGARLQMLKDAAATVTGSLMLPNDAKPAVRGTMWLTFIAEKVHCGEVSYRTDQMIYNM